MEKANRVPPVEFFDNFFPQDFFFCEKESKCTMFCHFLAAYKVKCGVHCALLSLSLQFDFFCQAHIQSRTPVSVSWDNYRAQNVWTGELVQQNFFIRPRSLSYYLQSRQSKNISLNQWSWVPVCVNPPILYFCNEAVWFGVVCKQHHFCNAQHGQRGLLAISGGQSRAIVICNPHFSPVKQQIPLILPIILAFQWGKVSRSLGGGKAILPVRLELFIDLILTKFHICRWYHDKVVKVSPHMRHWQLIWSKLGFYFSSGITLDIDVFFLWRISYWSIEDKTYKKSWKNPF